MLETEGEVRLARFADGAACRVGRPRALSDPLRKRAYVATLAGPAKNYGIPAYSRPLPDARCAAARCGVLEWCGADEHFQKLSFKKVAV